MPRRKKSLDAEVMKLNLNEKPLFICTPLDIRVFEDKGILFLNV